MSDFIALLRAVNVGGTGKLPMSVLKTLCEDAGLTRVRTYIASGNVLFDSHLSREQVKSALESRLETYAGKSVGVVLRTPAELAATLQAHPFPGAAPNRTVVIFFDEALPADCLATVRGHKDEQLMQSEREIWVHYGDGMSQSRLVIPAAKLGTARNLNTLTKLVELAGEG